MEQLADPDDPATTLLTTAQAASAAHVEPATIRSWAKRKKLIAVDHVAGEPRYRELDVLTVEAATRRLARARRLAAEALRGLEIPIT
jgi:hypothetical protein